MPNYYTVHFQHLKGMGQMGGTMRAPSSYDVTIIGAGNKSSFIERHGDSYFQKLVGVPERGLIMLLGSELRQELAFFLDTQV